MSTSRHLSRLLPKPATNRERIDKPESPAEGDVEIHDGAAPIALGVDGVEARGEQLALGIERFEEADRSVSVTQARELECPRERGDARLPRDEDVACGRLDRDRVAHLAERIRDRLLILQRRFARARLREIHAAPDLPAREERLQQAPGGTPRARGTLEQIGERRALAAVETRER